MRTARRAHSQNGDGAPQNHRARVLLVDLNNFSTFPTLAIGILIAALRDAGFVVEMISPLAHDVVAATRERREGLAEHLARRIHLSTWEPFRSPRDALREARLWWRGRPHPRVISETRKALASRPDIILLSAYLEHYQTVRAIGVAAEAMGVPLLLGGAAFNSEATAKQWLDIPSLAGVVGAEADLVVPQMVAAVLEGRGLREFQGVTLPDGFATLPAAPLRDLNRLPVPDFRDFPWDRYGVRIVPLMASRGCQWDQCTFCSDIISVSGRTFRTRTVDSVMHEMREQSRRHGTTNFLFLDLKLNSNPRLLRGIVENVQRHVPGAQWIGTVHVDQRADNGLSRAELKAAVISGMRRVSFGLESGSQRLLDRMRKGCTVQRNAQFLRDAHEVGLSTRCTMFKGYPGETAEDLEDTARFLEENGRYIDRIRFNEFSIMTGTPVYAEIAERRTWPSVRILKTKDRFARSVYSDRSLDAVAYRRAKRRVLQLVYEVNRRELRSGARQFDGLM